ncbi:MAG: hypothetical protein ABW001_08640 [Mycobacterium sp.]
MTRSPWRVAAGSGLLAVGLMVNASGAVAAAEPDSGAAHGADGDAPSSHDSANPSNPHGGVPKTLRTTIRGVTNALGAGQRPRSTLGSTVTNHGSAITSVPQMMAEAIRVQVPITGVSAQRQQPTTQTDDPVASPAPPDSGAARVDVPGAVAPVTQALAAAANQVTQAANDVVTPATGAVAAGFQSLAVPIAGVQDVVAPVSTEIATGLFAPVPDVLTSIQAILTSTTSALIPVTQIPSDFASLLGVSFGAAGAPLNGELGPDAERPSTVAVLAPLQTVQPLAGDRGGVATGDGSPTALTTPTSGSASASAIVGASSLNARARTAPTGAMSEGLQAFFDSYGALVIAASLSALAAAALPGLIAFLIPTAAGVGVGYRQAKAGIGLRASGIARFAGSGPLGIVRSGSFVALRSSPARMPRRDAERSQLAA